MSGGDAPRAGRNVPGGTVVTPSGAVIRPDMNALAALQGEFGIHSDAESLIEAHRRAQNPALRAASLLQVDADATEEAKKDLKGSAKKLGLDDDAVLTDVTVRGHALIGVVEFPNGAAHKVVGGWDDDYTEPRMTPAEAADAAAAQREAALDREVANLRQDFAEKFADLQNEHQTELSEAIAKIRESAEKEIAKVRDKAETKAEKQQAAGSSSSSSGSTRRTTRRKAGGRRKSTSSSRKPGAKGDQRTAAEKANETKGNPDA